MGYLKERHGCTMLPSIAKPGQCIECGAYHAEDQPHNKDSLRYQYRFYDAHGRWASWLDAMAHCTEEVQSQWKAALKEAGVSIDEEPETAASISISIEEVGE